jgi:hypothetical protein
MILPYLGESQRSYDGSQTCGNLLPPSGHNERAEPISARHLCHRDQDGLPVCPGYQLHWELKGL